MLAQTSSVMIEQPGQSLTAQPTQAVQMGHIIGAASQCRSIDANRIHTDIIRFNFVLLAAAKTRDDFTVADQEFSAAIPEGGNLLKFGKMDCASVTAELTKEESQGSTVTKKTPPKHLLPKKG
jgi:hypothetical protein